jgi:aryl-alcohol dehydrogenase-like predicted oxidoreductase
MQTRELGKTGERLSVVGFGGLVVRDVTEAEADGHVARAVERGVNYFDVAPAYGNAEERLGPALEPYRDRVFLACKTGERTAAEAEAELHRSLERLRTDRFDLYQFHAVLSVDEAEQILAPGGAMEAFLAARERGLIRHIGFSAHDEAAAVRLLEAFDFASVLLPINLFCWRDGGFGPRTCAAAAARGTAVLALKALARRPLPKGARKKWPKCWYEPIDTPADARAALAFTLDRPVTAAVSPSHAELLWLMCDAADALETGSDRPGPELEVEGAPLFPQ